MIPVNGMQYMVFHSGEVNKQSNEIIDFCSILNTMLNNRLYSFMTGVLFFDPRKVRDQENIGKYISDYNRVTGTKIDLYLLGYVNEDEADQTTNKEYSIEIKKNDKTIMYYFQPELYDRILEYYNHHWNLRNDTHPKIVLVDVEKERDQEDASYKETGIIVIDLYALMKKDSSAIEDKISKISDYANTHSKAGTLFKFNVLLGQHVPALASVLKSTEALVTLTTGLPAIYHIFF